MPWAGRLCGSWPCGVLLTSRISNGYQAIIERCESKEEALQEVQEAETIVEQSEEVVEEIAQKKWKQIQWMAENRSLPQVSM